MCKTLLRFSVFSISLYLYTGSLQATLIDFESFNAGEAIHGHPIADVAFTAGDTGIIIEGTTPGGALSGSRSAGGSPFSHAAPFRADFLNGPVNWVAVALGDFGGDQDNLFLRAYDAADTLLTSTAITLAYGAAGGFKLNVAASNIVYVLFGSQGSFSNSVYFDNFEYQRSTPESAAWLLFLAGIALFTLRDIMKNTDQ